jgi:aminopeptidase N
MEVDSSENISNFVVRQTPCLNDHPNLQTHMMDILFLNNPEDINSSENVVLKNVMINNSEETSFVQLHAQRAPKAVILNFNDWAYFKWVIDRRSLDYLKSNLHKVNDLLTKQLVYRSMFDLTRDAMMASLEYFDCFISAEKRNK